MCRWHRGVAGALVAAVGVTFIVVAIVDRLFTVGPAFERMSDAFRPVMKPAPIATLQRDVTGLQRVSTEFATKGVPMFSQSLKMTPEQFNGFMGQRFPAVATGMKELPAITTQFRGVVVVLSAEQARFAKADAIPTSSLPATTVPWALLAAGIVLLIAGLLMVFGGGLLWPAVAGVLGILLVVVPLTLSLPAKASAADTMNAHLKPVYTAQLVTGAKQSLAVVGAMGGQMQSEMLPALAQQLGITQPQLSAFLATNMPATAAALRTMPAARARFTNLVRVFDRHLADYDAITSTSFVPIVRILIGGGIAALVGGAWALAFGRRRETVQVEAPPVVHAKVAA